jgi:hypothetical protein
VAAPEPGSSAPPDGANTAGQHPTRTSPSLQAWAERMLAAELARCERAMTPDEWREHREWIEKNARASLLMVLRERAERGQL